jgi:LAO/AO transport system kinase
MRCFSTSIRPDRRQARRMRDVPVGDLVDRARTGDPRAVARLITLVENESPALREATRALLPHAGHSFVLGITGAPGVGKSTTTSALVSAFRGRGARVGVLAVDPSSPFTGGALLGDRVRMQEHATDAGVYIRSMATRGHLGGLAGATPQAVRVLDAAGCDVVMIETVGVGQSEIDVAAQADTTLVLVAPGLGDGVQAAKAGILEVGDVFVVNKADRDGADQVVRDLRETVRAVDREPGDWRQPIVSTVASKGEGLAELVEAIDRHRAWSQTNGERERRRTRRARDEIEAIVTATIRRRFADVHGDARLDELAAGVLRGELDPYSAAERVVDAV